MVITWEKWKGFNEKLTPSIQGQVKLRKLAGLFAGLGHLQPLLLATTNSHYLLDRFCMERCCSGEYISRIVTSMIFMEVIATLIIDTIGIYIANRQSTNATGTDLNKWNEDEEKIRGYISSTIQCLILVGYLQILYAFTTGGKKGHMHWFYVSLMIQQFVCLLIGGAIGFWDVGHALWYLMALTLGPVVVFIYQLYIHSWIRSHGPSDAEYLVVGWQILLALFLSSLATIFWTIGYLISYYPIELEIQNLASSASTNLDRSDEGRIATGNAITLARTEDVTNTVSGATIGSVQVESVTLTAYSATLITITAKKSGSAQYDVTLTVKAKLTIQFKQNIQSATKGTGDPTLALKLNIQPTSTSMTNVKVYSENVKKTGQSTVDISLTAEGEGTIESSDNITEVNVTIPVDIKVTGGSTSVETINSVKLNLNSIPTGTGVTDRKLTINASAPRESGSGPKTLTIDITAVAGGNNAVQAIGTAFSPTKPDYCIYSIREGTPGTKDIWVNIGGKCEYVACYYQRTSAGKTNALLVLYFRTPGGTPERKYFGTDDAGTSNTEWKTIPNEDKFIECLKELASGGSLTDLQGTPTDQYNREYHSILPNVWLPLIMQGLSVGAVGSIFPNLIPKTLVCPKTTRTLTVVNMFLVTVPHVINLALADNNCNPSSKPWDDHPGWPLSWLFYLFYTLAILFAIFNVHYPEWQLCGWIRNRTWFIFLMTLFTNVLNEVFNAISRGGIMTQRSAKNGDQGNKLNHPLLWNKMACLLSLSYLPFWLTTTPMMKSYVSSLDPFLCDKDRDHWPTARYGRLRSFGYWCKCACRGLYTSPRKLITRDMRKALTRKDPPLFYTLYGVLIMMIIEEPRHHYSHL